MCVWFEHSPGRHWYDWHSRVIDEPHSPTAENRIPVFDIRPFWPKMTRLYIAHWLLAMVTGTLAVAPWMPRRWSLRSLFIGVTAIAGLLSFIAWIDRTF